MSFDSSPVPSVMPNFPQGATLHSLATFFHRSSGARSRVQGYLRYYGVPKARLESGNPSGQGASHLAESFLGSRLSGAELIRRHTLLGLYGPAMHLDWWGNQRVAEIADGFSPGKFTERPWKQKPLSWCPDCCREDFNRFGWAPWRVVHQVPFIHHCPDHRTNLLTFCAFCNEPLDQGFHWRLPNDACFKCKSSSFRPVCLVDQCSGYQRLLRVLAMLNRVMASGEPLDAIRNLMWGKGLSTRSSRAKAAADQLSVEWGLSNPEKEIPERLGVSENCGSIGWSLLFWWDASPLAILLLISLFPEFD